MTKIASQHRTTFWKHARTYGKQIEVEELYEKWSIANHFSKELDTQVRALINSDLMNVKKAIQMSTEEFEALMSKKDATSNTEPHEITPSNGIAEPATLPDMSPNVDTSNITTPFSSDDNTPPTEKPEEDRQILPDMISQ